MGAARVAVLLGAMLLFVVQPLVGRMLLPSFGGLALVWTATVLVFQGLLLAGYLWAHLLRLLLPPRGGAVIQAVAVAAGALLLPPRIVGTTELAPGSGLFWQAAGGVLAAVGWPVFVLAATGPLVQSWLTLSESAGNSGDRPGREVQPYRLYALSNAGSLAGLFCYPLVCEPWLGLASQSRWWSTGFVLYAASLIAASRPAWRHARWPETAGTMTGRSAAGFAQAGRLAWMILAAVPSGLMMAVTTVMTQEVSSFPLIWVLPLGGYLVSWIVAFDRPQWFRRGVVAGMLLPLAGAGLVLWHLGTALPVVVHMAVMPLLCFFAGWVCHGELEARKPPGHRLTEFYLLAGVGGLAGSASVVLLAPSLFTGLFEFQVALAAALAAAGLVWWRATPAAGLQSMFRAGMILAWIVVAAMLIASWTQSGELARTNGRLDVVRGLYGVTEVWERNGSRYIVSGQTVHGREVLEAGPDAVPPDYYGRNRGVGRAIAALRDVRTPGRGLSMGVIGLGSGCLAGWARGRDEVQFFELNPDVVTAAWKWFDWLPECRKRGCLVRPVIEGDGRVSLAAERKRGAPLLDLLVVDAFSSDSIPVHLVTRECLELYRQSLSGGGLVAVHISNRTIDLRPVLRDAGGLSGWEALYFDDPDDADGLGARWIVMGNRRGAALAALRAQATPWPEGLKAIPWTDDYNSVLWLIDWRQQFSQAWIGRGTGFPGDRRKEAE